jgi:cell division FtsZ-interacting protein ZapD
MTTDQTSVFNHPQYYMLEGEIIQFLRSKQQAKQIGASIKPTNALKSYLFIYLSVVRSQGSWRQLTNLEGSELGTH